MYARPQTAFPRLGPGATPGTPIGGGTLEELYGGLQVRGTGCRLQGRPASGRRSCRTWSGSYTARRGGGRRRGGAGGGGRCGGERRPMSSKEERPDHCGAPGLSTRAGPGPATALGGQARQRGPLTPEPPRTQTGPLSRCSPGPPAPRDWPGAPGGDGRSYFTYSRLQLYLPSPLGETDEQNSNRREDRLSHTSVDVRPQPPETAEVTAETSSPCDPEVEVTTETTTTFQFTVGTSASEPPVFQRRGCQPFSPAPPQNPPSQPRGSGHRDWRRGRAVEGENLRPKQVPDGGTGPDSRGEPQRARGAPATQREPPLGSDTSGQRRRGAPGLVGRLVSPGVFRGRPPILEKTTKTLLWGPQGPQEIKSVCVLQGQGRPSGRKKYNHNVTHI